MTKPYSMDLRERVVSAVDAEGMSRHEAAARFGIAVSSAIRWVARYRKTGSVEPSKIGGYKPKTLRGEHASWLVARCQEKDFTISQLVEELQSIRGLKVDRRSVWEFLHAEGLSHKKNGRRTGARSQKTSSAGVNNGGSIRDASIPSAGSLSMKPGPRPTWRRFEDGDRAAAGLKGKPRSAAGRP